MILGKNLELLEDFVSDLAETRFGFTCCDDVRDAQLSIMLNVFCEE